ncbi:MAG: cytochrome-c peroxidase [Leclercia sp.]
MKKLFRITALGAAFAVACYLGLSGYVWYHDKARIQESDVQLSTLKENNQILSLFREKGCDYCHSPSTPLPFYASLPVAKQLMEYDTRLGYKSFNLEAVRGALIDNRAVSQSDLNKIEWVMQHKTMPPTRYVALHWAGNINDDEQAMILTWIKKQRESHYASADMAAPNRNEPVQPVPKSLPVEARKVALGFRLYHDTRLSGDSTLSCASCHNLNAGGVDGRQTSRGVNGAVGPINAPTVFNATFNSEQFWDGRAANLQKQAGGPPLNPIEMASKSWEEIIAKLDVDPALKAAFEAVYPQGFSGDTITDAIAEYEKTLITPNAPFDNWLRGDDSALTAQQKRGYALFKENKCATCHGGVILGGRSFEPLGLKAEYDFGEVTPADIGRMNVTNEVRDRLRQKVPGLRNVALTAPYFHRGDVPTLDEAVKLMLRYQVGTGLPQADVDDMVAFLESLTGVYTPYQQ